jgi:phage gp46-like protein
MTDDIQTEPVALPTDAVPAVDAGSLTATPVDDSLPADPAIKATAPDPVPASRPIRAKRHLALVTDTEAPKDTTGKKRRSAPDPETGLTDKQSKFCDGVESGLSLSDSYRAAYDASGMTPKSIHEAACRLFNDGKVTSRLQEISREKEAQRRMLTASDAAAAVETFRLMMTSAKTEAVRVRAAELLAKAAGLFVEKVEIDDKTDRSVSDIEQSIKDRLTRLGLTG